MGCMDRTKAERDIFESSKSKEMSATSNCDVLKDLCFRVMA